MYQRSGQPGECLPQQRHAQTLQVNQARDNPQRIGWFVRRNNPLLRYFALQKITTTERANLSQTENFSSSVLTQTIHSDNVLWLACVLYTFVEAPRHAFSWGWPKLNVKKLIYPAVLEPPRTPTRTIESSDLPSASDIKDSFISRTHSRAGRTKLKHHRRPLLYRIHLDSRQNLPVQSEQPPRKVIASSP